MSIPEYKYISIPPFNRKRFLNVLNILEGYLMKKEVIRVNDDVLIAIPRI